jgi:hypothetical protein
LSSGVCPCHRFALLSCSPDCHLLTARSCPWHSPGERGFVPKNYVQLLGEEDFSSHPVISVPPRSPRSGSSSAESFEVLPRDLEVGRRLYLSSYHVSSSNRIHVRRSLTHVYRVSLRYLTAQKLVQPASDSHAAARPLARCITRQQLCWSHITPVTQDHSPSWCLRYWTLVPRNFTPGTEMRPPTPSHSCLFLICAPRSS